MAKPVDFPIGHRCGRWTVISKPYKGSYTCNSVDCRCDCGVEKEQPVTAIKAEETLGCRECLYARKRKVSVGQRYGSLTVTGLPNVQCGNTRWPARCDCGKDIHIASARLLSGQHACRECSYELNKSGIEATHWGRIVAGARERNIELAVNWDYVKGLLESQQYRCALTGLPISLAWDSKGHKEGKTTASLDRIDSSLGYVEGNLQWIHKDFNRFKNKYSQEDFIRMCCLVADHSRSPPIGTPQAGAPQQQQVQSQEAAEQPTTQPPT